jgi:hypothetical protein
MEIQPCPSNRFIILPFVGKTREKDAAFHGLTALVSTFP